MTNSLIASESIRYSGHTIYFILTESCNLSCDFCIRKNLKREATMELGKGLICLNKIATHYNGSTLVITGGEPFMHKSWPIFVKEALKLFKRVIITTNGTFEYSVIEVLSTLIKKNLHFQVSLDGPQPIQNQRRGHSTFERVINNIKALLTISPNITISTTVTKETLSFVSNVVPVLNNLDIKLWKISQEQSIKPNLTRLIDNSVWNKFAEEIAVSSIHPVLISKMFDFDLIDKFIQNDNRIDERTIMRNCGFGKNKIYITPYFNVKPCSCVDLNYGNLFQNSICEIEKNIERVYRLDIQTNSVCYKCKYRQWCNGGCPGYSLKFFGRLGMGDIRCPYVQKSI